MDEDAGVHDDNEDGNIEGAVNIEVDNNSLPSDEYFKGYFAFALYGYSPPEEGEKYRSTSISVITDRKSKNDTK